MSDGDPDAERIAAIVEQGLANAREDDVDDLRLDSFVIVAIFNWTDVDGSDREGSAVWGESRRHYVKRGILELGIARVEDTYE